MVGDNAREPLYEQGSRDDGDQLLVAKMQALGNELLYDSSVGDTSGDCEFFADEGNGEFSDDEQLVNVSTGPEVFVSGKSAMDVINEEAIFHRGDDCEMDRGFGSEFVDPFLVATPKVVADPRSYFLTRSYTNVRDEMIALYPPFASPPGSPSSADNKQQTKRSDDKQLSQAATRLEEFANNENENRQPNTRPDKSKSSIGKKDACQFSSQKENIPSQLEFTPSRSRLKPKSLKLLQKKFAQSLFQANRAQIRYPRGVKVGDMKEETAVFTNRSDKVRIVSFRIMSAEQTANSNDSEQDLASATLSPEQVACAFSVTNSTSIAVLPHQDACVAVRFAPSHRRTFEASLAAFEGDVQIAATAVLGLGGSSRLEALTDRVVLRPEAVAPGWATGEIRMTNQGDRTCRVLCTDSPACDNNVLVHAVPRALTVPPGAARTVQFRCKVYPQQLEKNMYLDWYEDALADSEYLESTNTEPSQQQDRDQLAVRVICATARPLSVVPQALQLAATGRRLHTGSLIVRNVSGAPQTWWCRGLENSPFHVCPVTGTIPARDEIRITVTLQKQDQQGDEEPRRHRRASSVQFAICTDTYAVMVHAKAQQRRRAGMGLRISPHRGVEFGQVEPDAVKEAFVKLENPQDTGVDLRFHIDQQTPRVFRIKDKHRSVVLSSGMYTMLPIKFQPPSGASLAGSGACSARLVVTSQGRILQEIPLRGTGAWTAL